MTKEVYYIHDNYDRPFKVDINGKLVKIYKKCDDEKYEEKPFLEYKPEKIFIGKSPLNEMTKYSGGHGKEFDGNTILLKFPENKYIFIGSEILSFKSSANIIKYVSLVGNNDVPYPYAIDSDNNYYLLAENVIIKNVPPKANPYDYYYSIYLITEDRGRVPPKQPIIKNFQRIVKYYIGKDRYTLTYVPNASADYKRLIPGLGKQMYVVKTDGKKYILTEKLYSKLMKDFGQEIGTKPLKVKIIQKRL